MVRAGTAKKCTKQRDARAEFSKQCLLNLLPFHVGDGDGHENIAYKVNQCVLSISNAIIPIRVLCQMQANSDSGAEFLPVSLTQNVEHKLIEHILGDPGADKGGEGKSKRAEKYVWNEEK